MKFKINGSDKIYTVSSKKTNEDGSTTVFSNEYACALIGFVVEDDDIEIIEE